MSSRFAYSLLWCTLSAAAFAQVGGGGPGGPGPNFDANPQNPENWQILAPIHSGLDTMRRTEEVLNPNPNGPQYIRETANYSRSWTPGSHLFRNGVDMGTVELAYPFSKAIPYNETDTLFYKSIGTVTLKAKWISPFPIPEKARFRINSSANIHMLGPGSHDLDNALNSPEEIEWEDSRGWRIQAWKDDPELRTLTVSGDTVTIVLDKKATCENTHNDSQFTEAHANNGSFAIDPRLVTILAAGGAVYRPYLLFIPGVWQQNYTEPAANGDVVNKVYTLLYPNMGREVVPTEYSGSDMNNAEWTLGKDIYKQMRCWTYIPNQGGYGGTNFNIKDPINIPDSYFTYFGAATSQGIPGESYVWNGHSGSQGENLPNGVSYAIADYVEQYLSVVFGQQSYAWPTVGDTSWFLENDTQETSDLSLKYTWTDGVFGISKRKLTYINPIQDIMSGPEYIDWRMTMNPESVPFQAGGSSMKEEETAVYRPATWAKEAVVGVLQAVATGAGTAADVWAAPHAHIAGAVAGIAAFSGIGLAMVSDGSYTDSIHRSGWNDPGNKALWYYDGAWHTTPPANWVIGEWKWYVKARPKMKVTPLVKDVWGKNGFVDRRVGADKREQHIWAAPKIYYFEYNGGYGGPGGPGPGGGPVGPPGGGGGN